MTNRAINRVTSLANPANFTESSTPPELHPAGIDDSS
jgi:hypothetical protein